MSVRRSFMSSSFSAEAANSTNRKTRIRAAGDTLGLTNAVTEGDEDAVLHRRRLQDVEDRRVKEWENYQRSHRASSDHHHHQAVCKVFFDLTIADVPLGRLVLDLLEDVVPEAVENLRALAVGATGYDAETGVKLDYIDSTVHRIDKGVAVYFGELQSQNLSSTGQPCRDENFAARHLQRGVVSMVSRGPHTIGSVFCITLDRAPQLDYKYMVVGKVVDGLGLLEKIEALPTTRTGRPTQPVQINFCGALTGPKPLGAPSPVAEHAAPRDAADRGLSPEVGEPTDDSKTTAES
jgi:peptidylprolyl isomerase